MNRKTAAVIVELIPVVSAVLGLVFVLSSIETALTRKLTPVLFVLAFCGFVFYYIGRRICRGDRIVKLFGILDWLATFSIIGFYVLAILSMGM